jgi:hypothetical protein
MIVTKRLRFNPYKWKEKPRYELDISIDKKRVHLFYDYSEVSEKRLKTDIEDATGKEIIIYIPELPAVGKEIPFYLCVPGYHPSYSTSSNLISGCCPNCGERILGYGET